MHAMCMCMCMCVYNYRGHAIIQEIDYYTNCYIRLCHAGWPDSFLCCLPERSGGSSSTAVIAAVGRFNLCLFFVVVLFLKIIVFIILRCVCFVQREREGK